MELHGCKGCGSAVVEALLDRAGVAYRRNVFEWDDRDAWDRLRAINPLAQVPTLVLDDGTILTESAAIALWIASTWPEAGLLPVDPSRRALAYRWVVSFATNVYGPIIVGDFPSRWVDGDAAQDSLKAKALQRLKEAWLAFEAWVVPSTASSTATAPSTAPSTFLLGASLSVLDVYVAMISRWRPGRAWVAEHCPKTMAAVSLTEGDPIIAAAWARNFDPM